ncbi:uncharacterized protein BX663DRAFT_504369 [Cokeromyces recurvatus]|uniref:uncharacterized protein n=1 Tax=Cokeromyces recurvatus TaxID=90255 RepID=UPI002220CE9E|nr:uncharacterized protein BX663DRAFT_504369 [Cokeromyces recurvatus]KAI7904230.1 hypothetical protein BX663DRAFT_504369 [Cokeromyces recurvatus]
MSVTSPIYFSSISSTVSSETSGLYEYLTELVSKRVSTIKYIRKAHEGNTHWFNTILLTKDSLSNMYPNSKMTRRSNQFYALGLSLGATLDISNPIDYVKALNQIMTEFEKHTNDDSKQKMKNIFRKVKTKENHGFPVEADDYEYLSIPHIPFELDYLETFYTLIDVMAEAYYKLLIGTEGPNCTQTYFELVLKCDTKFKKITAMVTKELDVLARESIKNELNIINPLFTKPIEFED